jgi:hypothetical protein
MALIDTYRNSMTRKRDELSKLSSDKAKESAKISPLNSKIASAKRAMAKTKSESTIKSKQREIDRATSSLSDIDKKLASIDTKIAKKEKEYSIEEKKYRHEEDKLAKKLQKENTRQLDDINCALQNQQHEQKHLSSEIEKLKSVPEKITVLFFATNPIDTDRLRLDEEARSIQEMIRKSEHRDSIVFESRWAVRPMDILQAINELNPDVIHFSGHGADSSDLVLENVVGSAKLVTKEAITQIIMTSSDKIHLIFFNACFSNEQAQVVTEYVDAAIGMTTSISDAGACAFAAQFYSSLGFGLSIQKAFEQANAALMLESFGEQDTPQLYVREGIDSETMFIVRPREIEE